jgi:parvulin-like peptidyl-prolyl isomerase
VRIRTTGEALFTSLRGESGDYKVTLDQGVTVYRDPVSGEEKEQMRKLDFSLTPQCAIKLFRKRSQIGGRMAVSVMTFDPAGEIRNRYTFAEGTAKVNFGEEIVRVQDISFKTKADGKKADAKEQKSEEGSADAQEGASDTAGSNENSGNDSGFGAF